ncbi:MAG: ABC transporter ATP-binding protein [Oligoflexales bacterium]|nr:ABC transporter ATP-binding protein [Oligoflexales bacterium]
MDSLLAVKDLTKKYPSGFQFGSANFGLPGGSTVAFLGPNGAGKSTLFQMLTGNLDPSSGSITISGSKLNPDAFELKRAVGYLPQHLQLPRWVSAREVLRYAASLYQLEDPVKQINEMMERWDCLAYENQPLASCSHGMQKRVGLALANLHTPKLLILDEPFSGLDLYHMRTLEDLILSRRKAGLATIISTHITPFVAKLCEQVYIIKVGQVSKLENWADHSYEDKIKLIEDKFF